MKKTICLLLTALLLCALLGSCGKKTISEVDLTLTVGGTAVRPDTSVSALLDAFGTDYTYSEAVSCVYTGMDKTYAYSDRILYTYPDGDADRLLELYCTADVQTAQGVGIGASPRFDFQRAAERRLQQSVEEIGAAQQHRVVGQQAYLRRPGQIERPVRGFDRHGTGHDIDRFDPRNTRPAGTKRQETGTKDRPEQGFHRLMFWFHNR